MIYPIIFNNEEEHIAHVKNNPEFYKLFTVESESPISEDPVMAKGAGGKTGKSRGKQIRSSKIEMDDDFDENRVMMEGLRAKYQQLALPQKVLMATCNGKLLHFE